LSAASLFGFLHGLVLLMRRTEELRTCGRGKGLLVERNRLLPLAHFGAAFLLFPPAICLGVWQMLMRSPLPVLVDNPNTCYASVTADGSIMAYVFPTLFAMGFG
jgi:hypothetical protein